MFSAVLLVGSFAVGDVPAPSASPAPTATVISSGSFESAPSQRARVRERLQGLTRGSGSRLGSRFRSQPAPSYSAPVETAAPPTANPTAPKPLPPTPSAPVKPGTIG